MCHTNYKEKDPERSLFMVEALNEVTGQHYAS